MNIKLKDNPEKNGLLAGLVILVLALGFMMYKLISIQGQVSSLNSQQKVLQTVPPSQQLSKEDALKMNSLNQLQTAKTGDENYNEDEYAKKAREEALNKKK